MSHIIIKQPDKKLFNIFSTNVDDWLIENLTYEEVIMWMTDEEIKRVEERTAKILLALLKGNDPYFGIGYTYEEATNIINNKNTEELNNV